MIDLTNSKKLINLCLTHKTVIDKISNDRITDKHFIDSEGSRESKIISRIFKLIENYYSESSGSILTDEVFNEKINEAAIDENLKADIIAVWIDVKSHVVAEDDLHYLVEEIKQSYASKLLDEAISNLQSNLTDKGLQSAVSQMQSDLDRVHDSFYSLNIENTRIDITQRSSKFAEEYMHRLKNNDIFSGIMLGIPEIDDKTFGLRAGQLVVFLGPTGGGKSVQLLNAAINANRISNKKVLYLSFEMGVWDCELRTLSNLLGVSYSKLKSQNLSDIERKALFESYDQVGGAYFEYDANLDDPTPEYVEARYRELSMTKGAPDIIVVDYVGNMHSRGSRKNAQPWEKNGDAIEGLWKLCRNHHIPIITAQQINREVFRENRKKREEGKAAAMYQDAASGDQRLMHLSYYVIGIEPDRENRLVIYHPVKMRDAQFEPCIAMIDPDLYRTLPMTEHDQEHWKIAKGMKKIEDTAVINPSSSRRSYTEEDIEDDESLIPWN